MTDFDTAPLRPTIRPGVAPDPDDWRLDAFCASNPLRAMWTSDSRAELEMAAKLCVWCPVQTECEAYVKTLPKPYGVYAGRVFFWTVKGCGPPGGGPGGREER